MGPQLGSYLEISINKFDGEDCGTGHVGLIIKGCNGMS